MLKTAFFHAYWALFCIKVALVREMLKGSSPVDGDNFFLTPEEYQQVICAEPRIKPYIHRFLGAREYLRNEERYCLWIASVSPSVLAKSPFIMERIKQVRDFRQKSTKAATRKYADYPNRFMEMRQSASNYILVPRHSSEERRYIPFGFFEPDIICGDANSMIPDASLYHFGVLESNVHMAWIRVVCGRIKSDYRYSNDIVYNSFPWPNPTDALRAKIEQTTQAILDARALYPDASLADLCDELTMPPELRKAHQLNDKAVMEVYGIGPKNEAFHSESACVAFLMRLYQEMTKPTD